MSGTKKFEEPDGVSVQVNNRVRQKYPNAIAVSTFGHFIDKHEEHYRIWPTNNFFETRILGIGKTEDEAWLDALNNIEA